jgi:hypothetical protein
MMKQYGPLLGRILDGLGGDYSALGLHIAEHIKPADNG